MSNNTESLIEISDDEELDVVNDSDEEETDDEFDEDDFEQLKVDLTGCLNGIKTTGNVAVSKEHDNFVNPGLIVADTLIALPLVSRDAEIIKGVCRQAPFGRDDETVIDTSVRKTWELDRTQFSFSNPKWQDYVTSISDEAARSLAMSDVRAEPFKLLLYEKGSFFKRHKDSEKVPGLIGTLIICLPSKHEGGSVHLSHARRKHVFNTDKTSEFGLTSLAWFSDVTHEIKPVKSGYRLVLTYNIIREGSHRISANLVGEESSQLRCLLRKWYNYGTEDKLVYLLEHQYTESSLSLDNLKGRDKAVCQSLYEAGLEFEFTIFLARMTRTTTDSEWDDPEYSNKLKEVKNCEGYTIFRSGEIYDDNILGVDSLRSRRADSEDEGAFTGNESMPSTLRYHDTVVVIASTQGNLSALFDPKPGPRDIMSAISQSLRNRSYDHGIHSPLLIILEKVIEWPRIPVDGALLCDVVITAVKVQRMSLYSVAIYTSLENPASRDMVLAKVAQLIDEASHKEPGTPPDWDFWLGNVVTRLEYRALSSVATILSKLESLVRQDLKASFQEWKKSSIPTVADCARIWDTCDLKFFTFLLPLRFNDPSWLMSWFIPRLAKRGSKPLIYDILGYIYDVYSQKILRGATRNFQSILEGCVEKLALGINDLPKTSLSTLRVKFECADAAALKGFLRVIDNGMSMRLKRQITELLDKSCTNIYQSRVEAKHSCPIIVRLFLGELTNTLTQHRIPPLPSVKHLYEVLLRDVLLSNPPQDWGYLPQGCNCIGCQELFIFLDNKEARTCRFHRDSWTLRHMVALLPRDLFHCQTEKDWRHRDVLVVTKLYYNPHGDILHLEPLLWVFQCEYVEMLLGSDLYEELILRGRNLSPEGPQQSNKRRAGEEFDGSSASRPRLIE